MSLMPIAAQAEIVGTEVGSTTGDISFKGYVAYDSSVEGKPRPAIIVVHEWWGLNDYARDRARQLAALGYVALAIDMYGNGKTASHPDEAAAFSKAVMQDAKGAQARFMAAMDFLKNPEVLIDGVGSPMVDGNKIAAIGYCFGGAVVLQMARVGLDLDAVASFHGSLGAITLAQKDVVKAKILVAHGESDPFVPKEQVEAFKKEMDGAGVDYQFVSYPGAKHAFTNPSATDLGKKFKMPLEYNADADSKSWAQLQELLKQVFTEQ